MSTATTKTLSQTRIEMLKLLVDRGKISIDDIKDVDYKNAVKTALNSK